MSGVFGGGGGVDPEVKRIQQEQAARARRQEQKANEAAQREQAAQESGAPGRGARARGRMLLRFSEDDGGTLG